MNTLVVKVGGALLDNEQAALQLLNVCKQLQQSYQLILVHGGGALVEQLMSGLGLESTKLNGLRVTPAEHIPYITGALAGTANKQLCGLAIKAGLTPVGLSLLDGGMVECQTLDPRLGCVGSAEPGKADLLELLLEQNMLPVISSIGASTDGGLLNVNADEAATVIAKLLHAQLLLLSDVPGVLDGQKNLIKELSPQLSSELQQQGVISGGMTVKVKAAQQAADYLGQPVTIAGWQQPQLLLDLTRNKAVGTGILPTLQGDAL